jgi:CHAT domain-containing protein/Tfp pilus assembly protein PilF
MNKLLFFHFLLLAHIVCGQRSANVDSLMLNAQYDLVLSAIPLQEGDQVLLQNKKAEALIHLGRFEEAASTLQALNKNNNAFYDGIRLTNLGLLYMNQGRYDLAEVSLENAVAEFEKDGKGSGLEAAQAITNLGLVYNASGNYSKAKDQLMMALSLREKILKGNHELIAASYNDLGLAYANIDNDKALDYYEKALKIYQTVHGKDHPKIAIASINNGLIYRKLELYGDAVNNFETALHIWEKIYTKAHPAKAFALLNLGETYLRMQNSKSATGYYERSLAMYREVYGEKHPDIAQVLNALGNIELAADHHDKALSYFQQAMVANVNGFQSMEEAVNPSLKNYYNGYVLLYSLLYKAQVFEKRYFGKTLRFRDLADGLKTLQYCDSLIDRLRQQSTNENDKLALGVIANDVYANGVRLASETSLNAVHKKQFMELAFYFAEKSKSAVLLESISDANAKSYAGIPSSLMEEEKNLKSAMSLTTQKLSQKPTAEEEKNLRETAYNLNRSYESFIKKLEHDFPQYFNLKFNSTSPSMQEIQKNLKEKTAVLSYFIDESHARLYIFLITGKKYKVFERNIPKEFDKYITGFRNSIYFSVPRAYAETASKLSTLLIPKIPSDIQSLVILPTGRLSVIPYEALLTADKTSDEDFSTFPYLINKYSIRYEFSASLLLQKKNDRQGMAAPSILLCAPVKFPGDALPELPGTESEVTEISQLFSSQKMSASVNLREQATESSIKEATITEFNLLHLATHGVVDENNPELSRIFLYPDNQSEDGHLFSGEIYNLNLNANLVTLSACQTGLGKISKGEGVIGLSRALVYAGAKSIIVSYWSVADDSTADLMKAFYKDMLEKRSAGDFHKSLQKAKIAVRQNPKFAAPFYWAPFILIGY